MVPVSIRWFIRINLEQSEFEHKNRFDELPNWKAVGKQTTRCWRNRWCTTEIVSGNFTRTGCRHCTRNWTVFCSTADKDENYSRTLSLTMQSIIIVSLQFNFDNLETCFSKLCVISTGQAAYLNIKHLLLTLLAQSHWC